MGHLWWPGEIERKWCQRSSSGEWPQISSITWKFYKVLVCHLGCQLKYGCAIWIRKGKEGGLTTLQRRFIIFSKGWLLCTWKKGRIISWITFPKLHMGSESMGTFIGLIMLQRVNWIGLISYLNIYFICSSCCYSSVRPKRQMFIGAIQHVGQWTFRYYKSHWLGPCSCQNRLRCSISFHSTVKFQLRSSHFKLLLSAWIELRLTL